MLPVPVPGEEEFHLGVAFDEPRKFRAVRVTPADSRYLKDLPVMRVEYWKNNWPDQGSGGWARVDDDYHGRWEPIKADAKVEGKALRVDFPAFTGPIKTMREWYGIRFNLLNTLNVTRMLLAKNS